MATGQRHDRRAPGEARWATQLAAALTMLALVWTLIVVAAPMLRANGGQGRPGLSLLLAITYHGGSLICHQRPERSFHVAGHQMVVCARCFGLYAAGAAGLLLGWSLRRPPPARWVRGALAIGAAPIALTVGLEWLGLIETSNLLRMATGIPPGLLGGLVITGLLRGTA